MGQAPPIVGEPMGQAPPMAAAPMDQQLLPFPTDGQIATTMQPPTGIIGTDALVRQVAGVEPPPPAEVDMMAMGSAPMSLQLPLSSTGPAMASALAPPLDALAMAAPPLPQLGPPLEVMATVPLSTAITNNLVTSAAAPVAVAGSSGASGADRPG